MAKRAQVPPAQVGICLQQIELLRRNAYSCHKYPTIQRRHSLALLPVQRKSGFFIVFTLHARSSWKKRIIRVHNQLLFVLSQQLDSPGKPETKQKEK